MYPPIETDPNDPRDPYGTPLGDSNDNELQKILEGIYQRYQPQHQFSDQLTQLIQQMPQRQEQGKMANFMASLASLHPSAQGMSEGQPVGYRATDPKDFVTGKDAILNAPFYQSMNDWQAKLKPVEVGAQDERYNNTNLRALLSAQANQAIASKRTDLTAQNNASLAERREAQTKSDMIKRQQEKWNAEHPDQQLVFDAQGNVTGVNRRTTVATPVTMAPDAQSDTTSTQPTVAPDGSAKTGAPPKGPQLKAVGPIQVIDERGKTQLANTVQQGRNQLAVAQTRAALQNTQADRRLKDQEDLATFKAELRKNQPTTGEITQMHSARKMLDRVDHVMVEATELAKRGDWGLIQSAIRNTAAKYNWTGSPENIQRSADAFYLDLPSNGSLPHDTAVTEFASDLGFLASGVAYVHGQGRAGSSPSMINNMKELLTSAGDYGGFVGRMRTIKSLLQTYAAEPKGGVNNDIKSAIDEILKERKGGK